MVELAVSVRAPPVADEARIRKGAAVKIVRVYSEQTILGTARVTRNAAAVPQNKLICGYGGIGRRVRFRF